VLWAARWYLRPAMRWVAGLPGTSSQGRCTKPYEPSGRFRGRVTEVGRSINFGLTERKESHTVVTLNCHNMANAMVRFPELDPKWSLRLNVPTKTISFIGSIDSVYPGTDRNVDASPSCDEADLVTLERRFVPLEWPHSGLASITTAFRTTRARRS
jgi:hypothetical protein